MYVKYPIMGLSYGHGYFAICGGGGSLKSGIKNTVDIYQLSDSDPSGFEKDITAETGTELASGVAFSHDGHLIAVSVNAACWIYALDKKAKKMTLLIKFRTDFAAEESSQTSVCFVGNSTLLTGGEDGVVRVWSLAQDASAKDKAAGTASSLAVPVPSSSPDAKKAKEKAATDPKAPDSPKVGDAVVKGACVVTLTREYRGHSKRIREVHVDPSHRNLVASSSEDQTCHLWRLSESAPICKFSKDDAVDDAYRLLRLKPLVGPKKHQFRCVRFANDGRSLFTVLTPARGDTLLLKWKPSTRTQTKEDEWLWVVDTAIVAGDRPVASLCISPDDRFVGTAAVTGDVRVYDAADLRPYKKISKEEHTFAITGMGFMPPTDPSASVMRLVTGGADKQLLRHDVPLQGGALSSGVGAVAERVQRWISGLVAFVLSLFMGATLLFILLLFTHAKNSLLLNGPLSGFEDLLALRFESQDAMITLGLSVTALVFSWASFLLSSATGAFFWNGVLCTTSMLLSFFVAISPDLELQWKTGDAPFDELLDYKIPILLGACSIVFFFFHSLLMQLR